MTQTIKCIGWVFAGIGIVAAGAAALLAATALFVWAGMATAVALGCAAATGPLFMIGYMLLAVGVAVGVLLCVDNRR